MSSAATGPTSGDWSSGKLTCGGPPTRSNEGDLMIGQSIRERPPTLLCHTGGTGPDRGVRRAFARYPTGNLPATPVSSYRG